MNTKQLQEQTRYCDKKKEDRQTENHFAGGGIMYSINYRNNRMNYILKNEVFKDVSVKYIITEQKHILNIKIYNYAEKFIKI